VANKFALDANIEKYSIGCIGAKCSVRIRYTNKKFDNEITGKNADEYVELTVASRPDFAQKHERYLIFHLGASEKFGKQFNITYKYYTEGTQKQKKCKKKDYKISIFGQCDVRLSDNWSITYHRINFEKYQNG